MATIEVYADIWCPFTHVGLRTVLRRRGELGRDDVSVRVRSWPLELVNGEPLSAKSTAEHVEELRKQVAPDMFTCFDSDHFPWSTLPALALACAAYRLDDRTGEVVSLALRDALFEEVETSRGPTFWRTWPELKVSMVAMFSTPVRSWPSGMRVRGGESRVRRTSFAETSTPSAVSRDHKGRAGSGPSRMRETGRLRHLPSAMFHVGVT